MSRMSFGRLTTLLLVLETAACYPWLPAPKKTEDAGPADAGTPDAAVEITDAAGLDAAEPADAAELDAAELKYSPDASGALAALGGGRLTGVAQSQGAAMVYVAADEHGGVYVSSDQGTGFAQVVLPRAMAFPVVGTSYGSTDVVLLADAKTLGAYINTQRGAAGQWTAISTLANTRVQRFIPSASMPGRVYAIVLGLAGGTDGGGTPGGVWMSDDNGQTFAALGFAAETAHDVFWNGTAHIAATERGVLQFSSGVTSLSNAPVNSVVSDPSQAGSYLAANAAGDVFRVFTSAPAVFVQQLRAQVPEGGLLVHSNNVYALAGSRVFSSTPPVANDAGPGAITSFLAAASGDGEARFTGGVVRLGANPGLLLTTGGGGLKAFSITGSGLSAVTSSNGINAQRCAGLQVASDGVLLGCVLDGNDGGMARIWNGPSVGVLSEPNLGGAMPLPTPGGPVAVARGPDGTQYAAKGSLYRHAAGGSWERAPMTTTETVDRVFSVDAHATTAGTLVVGVMRSNGIPQVLKSSNNGDTATAIPGTLGVMPWNVAFNTADATNALVVSLPERPWRNFTPLNLERGLFETRDTFATLVHGGPTDVANDEVSAVTFLSGTPPVPVAVTGAGRVYKRTAPTENWTLGGMVMGLYVMSMTSIPNRPTALVAAGIPTVEGTAALQVSQDSGLTWRPLDEVAIPAALRVVADPAAPDALLVSTVGQGIWTVKTGP